MDTDGVGYYGAGLVLVGDAAHGVHPLAGMGLNLGLKDLENIPEVFKEHGEVLEILNKSSKSLLRQS